jgi:hypothetical protein
MIEIIASTMLIAESLATLMDSIIKNPKNLQDGFKVSSATTFYNSIGYLNHNDYSKLLSLPQKDSICDAKICNLDERLDNFGKILDRFKKYYFGELDLYNSYKHGFRLFLTETYQGEGNYIDTLAYFSQNDKHDQLKVRCMEVDPNRHLEIAVRMAKVMRLILSNYKNMIKNPENYKIVIPED